MPKMWRTRFGVALLALPLGACILAGEKPELGITLPGAYKEGPRKPDVAPPALDWWRGFHDRELTKLMEEALAQNFDIAVAVDRILQADANARVAGAPLLPNIDANASATRARSSRSTGGSTFTGVGTGGIGGGTGGTTGTGGTGGTTGTGGTGGTTGTGGTGGTTGTGGTGGVIGTTVGGGSERSIYQASLAASYELDFWGKNAAALRTSEETAIATRFDREVVALTTAASVANAYFQVLAAQDRLRVARDNVSGAERILNVIQQRFNVGTASALDLAQQQSLVGQQRANIPPLVQTLRQTSNTLALLVGRPPELVSIRGGTMRRIRIPRVTPGLPSDILTQRPDIREAEANLASANANVDNARAQFFPSIQLTANGGYQSLALQMLFTPQSAFYSAAASLTQPIFDGFRLQGNLDFAKAQQDQLLQAYRKSIISGFVDVENALIAVQQNADRERLQRDVVASSRKAFEISETQLRAGTVDLVTVLNTEQSLFQAQDLLAQIRLLRLQAIVSLYQALGGGWTPEGKYTILRAKPVVAAPGGPPRRQ